MDDNRALLSAKGDLNRSLPHEYVATLWREISRQHRNDLRDTQTGAKAEPGGSEVLDVVDH